MLKSLLRTLPDTKETRLRKQNNLEKNYLKTDLSRNGFF